MTDPLDQHVASSEKKPKVEKATSGDEAVEEVIATRNPTGLLDLPAELRSMIFHHLLVCPVKSRIWLMTRSSGVRRPVEILRTSKLIYREAFDVLYRENNFANCLLSKSNFLRRFPRVIDAIQNIYFKIDLDPVNVPFDGFLRSMRYFGNPSIIRGTLTIDFWFGAFHKRPLKVCMSPLRWFVRALARFTNFRTIELNLYDFDMVDAPERVMRVLDSFKAGLESVLGRITESTNNRGNSLRFHPLDHRNRARGPSADDWADSLSDGIRLEWNQDLINADDSGTLI